MEKIEKITAKIHLKISMKNKEINGMKLSVNAGQNDFFYMLSNLFLNEPEFFEAMKTSIKLHEEFLVFNENENSENDINSENSKEL